MASIGLDEENTGEGGEQGGKARFPFGSQQFRDHFREHETGRLGGPLYALANLTLLLAIMGGIAWSIGQWHGYFLLLLPLYFLFVNGVEYVLHRFPMHRKMPGAQVVYEHVTIHHNFFADQVFYFEDTRDYYAAILPFYIFIGLTVVICGTAGLVYLVAGLDNALFFALVGYGYYLLYELLHFSYHTPDTSFVKRLPFVRSLARQHILHHQVKLMAHYNFNITFPIFDVIMGTMYKGPTPPNLP